MRERIIIVNNPPAKPNHILHLLLSLVTGGLWLPVWFLISLAHGVKTSNKAVANLGGSLLQGIRAGMADTPAKKRGE